MTNLICFYSVVVLTFRNRQNKKPIFYTYEMMNVAIQCKMQTGCRNKVCPRLHVGLILR